MSLSAAACSSCGRAIIWATSPTGAPLPLTAKPVTVYEIDTGGPGDTYTPDAIKVDGGPYYISHFVDCPNAAQHSRKAVATVSWVYIQSEPGLYTVGFYDPDGKWNAESDYPTREQAAERVHYLNGGAS